jgi:hypothetical protein
MPVKAMAVRLSAELARKVRSGDGPLSVRVRPLQPQARLCPQAEQRRWKGTSQRTRKVALDPGDHCGHSTHSAARRLCAAYLPSWCYARRRPSSSASSNATGRRWISTHSGGRKDPGHVEESDGFGRPAAAWDMCGTVSVRGIQAKSFGHLKMTTLHRDVAVCKTVGSAYVGSNPTPATTCENGPLAANARASGPFLLCPVMCHLVSLWTAVSRCPRTYR